MHNPQSSHPFFWTNLVKEMRNNHMYNVYCISVCTDKSNGYYFICDSWLTTYKMQSKLAFTHDRNIRDKERLAHIKDKLIVYC
jgi:hypothetical protein